MSFAQNILYQPGDLKIGSVPPTTPGQDNDTFIVTSDGTETGSVVGVYKYDAQTATWLLTGGSSADQDNQQIGLNSNIITLSGGLVPDSTVDLTPYLDNTDAQVLSAAVNGANLDITISNGNTVSVPLSSLGSDDQLISLTGNTLTLENGGTVDLAAYLDNTDAQTIALASNIITLSNGTGADTTVDLTPYLDNTDAQTLSGSLTGTDLVITVSNGNTITIPLASIDTDDQTLTLAGSNLSIADGNTVDLTPFLDNTDAQVIGLSGNTVTLSNGTGANSTFDLTPYLDNTDDQTITANVVGTNLVIEIEDGNTQTIPLASLGTDDQRIADFSINASNVLNLEIEDGNTVTVDLTPYLDNTDDQVLALIGNNLTLEDGGTPIDLSPYLDDTDVSGFTLAWDAATNELTGTVTEDGVDVTDTVSIPFPTCPEEMTRAQLLALRNAGTLDKNCHYVITDPAANGTLQLEKVLMHAVDADTLSGCYLKTAHDNIAWNGFYDIDANQVIEVTDNLGNKVISNASIVAFPFGMSNVIDNEVSQRATFTVTTSGVVAKNVINAGANVTVTAGDFRENNVLGDATVVSSTTGDVDNNTFGEFSNSTISGTSNVDTSSVGTDANLNVSNAATVGSIVINQECNVTVSGGNFADSTVGNDSNVTITSGSNYENTFDESVVYNQVGTGYIRYTKLGGNTTWTNGNTNISNTTAHAASVNTTGSAGVVANSNITASTMTAIQNIPDLTINGCTIANAASISSSNAARLYIYRTTVTDGGRILGSANGTMNLSYAHIDSYGYIQNSAGGTLRANYASATGVGYIRNTTPNSHIADRCSARDQANIRFDATAADCRIYYSMANSGSAIYHNGSSNGSWIYYSSALSNSSIFTTDSVNARIYYSNADSRGFIRSIRNSATHYFYYCDATASGYVDQIDNTGTIRQYAVSARAQSIIRVQNTAVNANMYYSTVDAYYYLLATLTGGTRSGLYGMGRRSYTVTGPVTGAPYASGASWQNIQ